MLNLPKFDVQSNDTSFRKILDLQIFLIFQINRNPFQIEYGDGSLVKGFLSQDTIRLAGITIKKQIFAEITSGLDGFDGVYDVY